MKSELVAGLVKAHVAGDQSQFIQMAEELIRDEEQQNHHLLADRLRALIEHGAARQAPPPLSDVRSSIPVDRQTGFPLMVASKPRVYVDDLVVDPSVRQRLERIVEENRARQLLTRHGLQPKRKILLSGPPGTGKTMTAQVIATAMDLPLATVRFDAIVSSLLGETAANLRKVFDFLNTTRCVALFDEFDVIGKRRDDPSEHGEIKRVVNNFMLMMDAYSGTGIMLAATNHSELLDKAIWRRFDEVVAFELPDEDTRASLFERHTRTQQFSGKVDFEILAQLTKGFSGSDIAQACHEAIRGVILSGRKGISSKDLEYGIADQRRRREALTAG